MPIPNEGETLLLNMLLKRILTDRDADLEVLLYTNVGLDLETATEAALTEPTEGGGYVRVSLTDANWVVSGDEATHAVIDFVPSGASWAGVHGAAIVTKSAGGTQRILGIGPFPAAPVTVADGQTFRVDPTKLVT